MGCDVAARANCIVWAICAQQRRVLHPEPRTVEHEQAKVESELGRGWEGGEIEIKKGGRIECEVG